MFIRTTRHLKNVIKNPSFNLHYRSICLQNNLNNNSVNNEECRQKKNGLFKNFNTNSQLSRKYTTAPVDLATAISPPITKYEVLMKFLIDNPAIEFCQQSLISFHASTGLPWWATIVLVTCTARTLVTLPCSLYQQYILAKVTHVKYEMNELVKELKRETNIAVTIYGWTEDYGRSVYNRSLKKQWDQLIIRDNCHPMKGMIIVIFQVPLWVMLSASIRNICFMLPYPTEDVTYDEDKKAIKSSKIFHVGRQSNIADIGTPRLYGSFRYESLLDNKQRV
ncbi:hypothetical protein G9C98_004275 [Cotesia typhae]|uniref:Mitochondrial inner membrane protein COX18 n=1 Tax=Cotesia typhae TaxID=2053667 RepID=A0A8J5R2S5_9HYME|nr:hypothetical protein G9C98_004275 [Cotesia typhae]